MPTIYRKGKLEDFNNSIMDVGSFALQKQIKEQNRQQELQDAVKKALITSVLTGKGKFKTPVDINQLMAGGAMPNLQDFEPINTPSTSISISERPYSEIQKAQEILARTPEDYYREGMASGKGSPKPGWFFGLGNEGYLNDEKGKRLGNKPIYSEYDLSPAAQSMQSGAQKIVKNPYRVTKRLGSKGAIDIEGMDVTGEETKDAETRYNELITQGLSEDEAYQQLKEEGYTQ